jgi:type I restriction enzyme, S subunit
MARVMKDSGIEWIGEIPEDWGLRRLKYILRERKQKNDPIITKEILSLSMERGVFPYSDKKGGGNKAKEDYSAYKVTYPGDIVVNSMNILAGSVGLSKYMGAVSPVYYTYYSDSNEANIRYYNLLFQSNEFQKSLLGLGNGILIKESGNGKLNTIRMRIPSDKLNNLLFPIPSADEQQKIANFLDGRIAFIDKIIADTKQSIVELRKYKQAMITEAVTKGLDPNVKMKDSGIEWIGEVPDGWKVVKSKYSLTFNKGLSITKENLTQTGIPVISYGQVHSKYSVRFDPYKDELPFVTKSYLENKNARMFKGDFIFADTSEDYEGAGNFSMLTSDAEVLAGYHSIVGRVVNENIISEYLAYYFASDLHRNQIRTQVSGIKVFSITQQLIKNTYTLIPSMKEQQKIADYLDEKTAFIDRTIVEKESIINEYEFYKKSLIYEYVTGKKEVPND